MSQTTHPDLDPWHGLLYAVIERLIPLFKGTERGETYARYAAGEAIAAFNPESRADYASIGRILALSLSAITAAAQSVAPDLSGEQQIRFLTKAQSLSRTADQAERMMMTRRRLAPRDEIADTLIPRPPKRPAHYRPLPPDDPASGASIAARQAQEVAATQGEKTNFTPPAANSARLHQTNSAAPTPPQREQRPHAPAPSSGKPRLDHQTSLAPHPSQIDQIGQTNSAAHGPVTVPRSNPERHGRVGTGEQTTEERTLEAFIRTALAAGGPSSDRGARQPALGLPDHSAPPPPEWRDRSGR
jgi:hypothetical protein